LFCQFNNFDRTIFQKSIYSGFLLVDLNSNLFFFSVGSIPTTVRQFHR
jgi:hypothetical protein